MRRPGRGGSWVGGIGIGYGAVMCAQKQALTKRLAGVYKLTGAPQETLRPELHKPTSTVDIGRREGPAVDCFFAGRVSKATSMRVQRFLFLGEVLGKHNARKVATHDESRPEMP